LVDGLNGHNAQSVDGLQHESQSIRCDGKCMLLLSAFCQRRHSVWQIHGMLNCEVDPCNQPGNKASAMAALQWARQGWLSCVIVGIGSA